MRFNRHSFSLSPSCFIGQKAWFELKLIALSGTISHAKGVHPAVNI